MKYLIEFYHLEFHDVVGANSIIHKSTFDFTGFINILDGEAPLFGKCVLCYCIDIKIFYNRIYNCVESQWCLDYPNGLSQSGRSSAMLSASSLKHNLQRHLQYSQFGIKDKNLPVTGFVQVRHIECSNYCHSVVIAVTNVAIFGLICVHLGVLCAL